MGNFGVPEKILEVVDGSLVVAEEFNLLSFPEVELMDGVQLFEVSHGF